MGNKTTTNYFCDNCKSTCKKEWLISVIVKNTKGQTIDLCHTCLGNLVNYALKNKEVILRMNCKECEGKGNVKSFYGPGNDFNWEKCTNCEKWG